MRVVTPGEVARHTGSKYLGVLVSAKYARRLNEFRRGEVFEEGVTPEVREKLTTTSLASVASGDVDYTLVERKRDEY